MKRDTPEPNSAPFIAHLAATGPCVTADIAALEFWTTVRRKEAEGVLIAGAAKTVLSVFDADIESGLIQVETCDEAVRKEFQDIVDRCHAASPPIFIRTNDALHLAAARQADETEIVATDKRLREAALLLGFSLYPPV